MMYVILRPEWRRTWKKRTEPVGLWKGSGNAVDILVSGLARSGFWHHGKLTACKKFRTLYL